MYIRNIKLPVSGNFMIAGSKGLHTHERESYDKLVINDIMTSKFL